MLFLLFGWAYLDYPTETLTADRRNYTNVTYIPLNSTFSANFTLWNGTAVEHHHVSNARSAMRAPELGRGPMFLYALAAIVFYKALEYGNFVLVAKSIRRLIPLGEDGRRDIVFMRFFRAVLNILLVLFAAASVLALVRTAWYAETDKIFYWNSNPSMALRGRGGIAVEVLKLAVPV